METETKQELMLQTPCGALRGIENAQCSMFLGVPFAHAARFEHKNVSKMKLYKFFLLFLKKVRQFPAKYGNI